MVSNINLHPYTTAGLQAFLSERRAAIGGHAGDDSSGNANVVLEAPKAWSAFKAAAASELDALLGVEEADLVNAANVHRHAANITDAPGRATATAASSHSGAKRMTTDPRQRAVSSAPHSEAAVTHFEPALAGGVHHSMARHWLEFSARVDAEAAAESAQKAVAFDMHTVRRCRLNTSG